MRSLPLGSKRLSRRRFMAGATAATIIVSTGARAADFRWRLGLSQPLDSPNFIRLKEMADRIRTETNGRLDIEVLGAGALGSDSKMLDMVQKGELELYNAGNVLGPIVPVAEMPGLPFTFKSPAEVFKALDGDLGDYIHAELLTKGIYTFRYWLDNGFHHLTTSTKPIRSVEDLKDMTIRTPVQEMTVDFFQALGAKPMKFTLNRLYEVLKDKTCDGQTDPLGLIVLMKLYEVQTHLSMTNHWWSGFTFTASAAAWKRLPEDLQAAVERNAKIMAMAQRQDTEKLTAQAVDILRNKGMIVNTTDTSGFKKPLDAFYRKWKANYGTKAWELLEARVGKLV
jgi:TRAP-type transport system periplasmic protein